MAARAICQRNPDTAGANRERTWVGNMWLYVAGILKLDVLAPDIDSSVLAGYAFAEKYLGFDGHPAAVYIKATSMQWPVLAQNLPSGTGSTTQTGWRLATQIEPYGCPRVGTNHD